MSLSIRQAGPQDAGQILRFVRALADYENLLHEVEATLADIEAALSGPAPRVFCDIAEWDGAPVGIALWFYNFSTFSGRHGIYLEDLYVEPAFRGRGIARALLVGLARRCIAEKLRRLEWWVLDWNEPALRFYRSLDARPMSEWTVQRVSGAALEKLAAED